jgi:1-acyl-sn-glycerol-3-phosphate acyltransferase
MGQFLYGIFQIVVGWFATLGTCATSIVLNILTLGQGYRRLNPWILRHWGSFMLRLSRVKIQVEGLEHINAPGASVILFNHASLLDLFVCTSMMPRRGVAVMKKEFSYFPIMGQALHLYRFVFLDRGDSDRARNTMTRLTERVHREGIKMWMAPEGTRARSDEMLPFRMGAFHVALNTRAPLVPCVIYGARKIHPYGDWSTRPGNLWVRILPPISTEHLTRENLRDEADTIRNLYLKILEEMAETYG